MTISQLLIAEFHNEIALFEGFGFFAKCIYVFYMVAGVLVIRPHLKQMQKYKVGDQGHGDLCFKAQIESLFWRMAPLFFSIVINSKLLFLSVAIDLIGRLLVLNAARNAELRFQAATKPSVDEIPMGLMTGRLG